MINAVVIAMKKTTGWESCWWDDELIQAVLRGAADMGWVLRTSHTQVEWTQKGIDVVEVANLKTT